MPKLIKLILKPCESCGALFSARIRNEGRREFTKFCSPKCRLADSSERQSGINNHRWKGGISKEHYRYTKVFRKRHGFKHRAHLEVKKALSKGLLVKKPCEVCGSPERVHGHHDDYAKPLDVKWLCQKHHIARHNELRKAM